MSRLPKIVLALLVQGVALLILAGGVYIAPLWVSPPYPYWFLVVLQGMLAALLSCRLGLPCWWRWIQFLLPVGLYLGLMIQFNPLWALATFIVVWLVFSNTFKERVPLYLTNSTTRQALKALIAEHSAVQFMDLGCGLGGNVVFVAQLPEVKVSHGVETAPLPYLLSKLYTLMKGGQTYALDMWKTDLANYDVVYAFLSPEPMPKLWQKVLKEMRPGSVFISNSFAVPDVEPSVVWELSDGRKTQLFLYHLADFKS